MPKPHIDISKCSNCGTCIATCPLKVFEKGEKFPEVKKPEACIGCKACEAHCPKQAIKVKE